MIARGFVNLNAGQLAIHVWFAGDSLNDVSAKSDTGWR